MPDRVFCSRFIRAEAGLLVLLASACTLDRTFEVRGRVVGFGSDSATVIVSHEEIPRLMPAMTMPFRARDAAEISGLQHGDGIAFQMHVSRRETRIDRIRALTDRDPPLLLGDELNQPVVDDAAAHLMAGDALPEVSLIDQDSTVFSLPDLRGKVIVMSFIYTRCPLPDYCPLMSERMSSLQELLGQRYGGRLRLLSVTLDPTFDTPLVLRRYAERYTSDTASWTFATGSEGEIALLLEALGVTVLREGTAINHSLVTAVVDEDGRLSAVWRGNQWETKEVASRVEFLLTRRDVVN